MDGPQLKRLVKAQRSMLPMGLRHFNPGAEKKQMNNTDFRGRERTNKETFEVTHCDGQRSATRCGRGAITASEAAVERLGKPQRTKWGR